MEPADVCALTIAEASRLIARKELSPVEVLSAHLERIEDTDGKLNSFITLMRDESIAAARRSERVVRAGNHLGPLHGIPIGLKDLYFTKGVRTTIGSKIMRDFVPETDAAVTEKFKGAGAIIIGKLQMHEFAMGPTSVNPHDGPAHNPWDVECMTGGSSGGSGSAVAAGQCMGALGSDTGGSITHTVVALRHRGPEADLWPGQPVRRVPAELEPGHRGPHGPDRARRGPDSERHRRARHARPVV